MEDFEDYEEEDFEDEDDEWDDGEDEWGDLDDELSPGEIAEMKRRMQDANDGFTYTMCVVDGETCFKCNKCHRTAPLHERPFPHKLHCPMRKS